MMPRAAATTPKFATEVDLCKRFLDALPGEWTAYAETAGWDILLVRKSDGFQIGVQAKLKLNAEVLNQALEDGGWAGTYATRPGPDCRAVLVPWHDAYPLRKICAHLGITVIDVAPPGRSVGWRGRHFDPDLPKEDGSQRDHAWYECCPSARHKLPAYVPDVDAGSPAPVQLTEWKIQAIKLAVTLEKRGYVTREDFKHLRLDHRRWIEGHWLTPDHRKVWVAGRHFPNFRVAHPRNYEEIAADYAEWARDHDPLRKVTAPLLQPELPVVTA